MLYIVTAIHNRYKITEKFIDNLKKQTYKDWNLILVDDGSTDGTGEMVKEKLPKAVILHGNGNLFWGGALHKVYKCIKKNSDIKDEDFVLISNDDTIWKDDFLETGVSLLKENPECLITGCGFGKKAGEQVDGAIYMDFKENYGELHKATAEGNCASTRELFLTAGIWRRTGGFHPLLLPHYLSDYEFTTRAAKKGFKIKSFEKLSYEFDEGTTGDNGFEGMTVKKLFSKRCSSNPIYKFNYIFLVTPKKYLLSTMSNQIKRYIKHIKIINKWRKML